MELEFVGYELKEPKYTLERSSYPWCIILKLNLCDSVLLTKKLVKLKLKSLLRRFPNYDWDGYFYHQWWWTYYRFSVGALLMVFTLTIRSIKTVKWVTDQQLFLTVGHGLSWNWFKRHRLHHIDRTRKIPFTTLVRALGFSGDDEIVDIFGDGELVRSTIEKDIHKIQQIHVLMKRFKNLWRLR